MSGEDTLAAASVGEVPQYSVLVKEAPKFDLKSYISAYKGRTVFRRLFLIASCSTVLKEDAARLAVIEAKKGTDVNNYNAAVTLLRSATNSKDAQGLLDTTWATEQEKKNASETKRMENELKQYKNNLIRESIRMGNEDLGLHYHAVGDLSSSTKSFSRMRDYCTTPTHVISTAFRIISVAIEQRNWLAVQSQVHKIRSLQTKGDEAQKSNGKTSAATGLQLMSLGEYKDAAFSFLSVDPSLGDSYNDVLTSNDVAVYGGLCALASMSRVELQETVLDDTQFRNFLELEPHIRRAIAYFCASKYQQCLEILESYRADYLLDIYLQPQLDKMYSMVRTKSVVQYFQPFSRVTLSSMEKMFGDPSTSANSTSSTGSTSISQEFLSELSTLIQDGLLHARIDLESSTLVATNPDLRARTQKEALDTVDKFIAEARLKLLRLNVINAGLEVKPAPRGKSAVGGMDLAGVGTDDAEAFIQAAGVGNFGAKGYSLRGAR